MKVLKIIALLFLGMQLLHCIPFVNVKDTKEEIKYFSFVTISPDFSYAQHLAIIWAVSYFQESVPCILLEVTDYPPPLSARIIHFEPLSASNLKNGREIGFYFSEEEKERILVWPYEEKDRIVKITLHELAHAFGMSAQHAFPKEWAYQSNLSPIISYESFPILYTKDKEYLNKLICEE